MDYRDRLTLRQLEYKASNLPGLEDGVGSARRTSKTDPHILPQAHYQLNILPGIRDRFWKWFEDTKPRISRHRSFHHLNSSQAMAFNLFFPLVDERTGRADARLLKAIGLPADAAYTGYFEKVIERDENTHFDFYLEGPAGRKVFFELKLSESEFGSCRNDPRHCRKLDEQYRPYLTEHVDPQWLEQATFFQHYEILRNISYLGRHPDSGLVFIFPKANEALAEAETAIKRIVSKSLAPRVAILYLEYLVERILGLVDDDAALRGHYLEFRQKYVVPRTG